MTEANNRDREREPAGIQRDIGRLEGKVDSMLTGLQNMLESMIRADAERDNLARDMTLVERKATEAMDQLRREFQSHREELQKQHSDLKSKLYWLAGSATAGGMGIGVGAQKIIAALFGLH